MLIWSKAGFLSWSEIRLPTLTSSIIMIHDPHDNYNDKCDYDFKCDFKSFSPVCGTDTNQSSRLVHFHAIERMVGYLWDHDYHGLPAYSHHDKIPPWWGNVSNDKVGMCQCQIPTIHDKLQLQHFLLVVQLVPSAKTQN